MLQRIHNILAWLTINNKTELSIWALKLQTVLTNRWPHLNERPLPTLEEMLEGFHVTAGGTFLAYKKVRD